MVQVTMPSDLDIYQDGNDPTEPGDIKINKGTLQDIHHCDALDDGTSIWSVHSGVGVTIALDTSVHVEGTGCIKVTVPSGITAIVKATKSAGSWDISLQKYLKVWLKRSSTVDYMILHFGEAAYDEQTSPDIHPIHSTVWSQKSWDISAIAVASRNAVTIFALEVSNIGSSERVINIDYVYADPGPSQIKAYDGDKTILVYPKFYVGTYTGDGFDDHRIDIPRKGIPDAIMTFMGSGTANAGMLWTSTMTVGNSQQIEGGAILTTGIKSVGDCYFTLGTHARVNKDTEPYHYMVWWAD